MFPFEMFIPRTPLPDKEKEGESEGEFEPQHPAKQWHTNTTTHRRFQQTFAMCHGRSDMFRPDEGQEPPEQETSQYPQMVALLRGIFTDHKDNHRTHEELHRVIFFHIHFTTNMTMTR